MQKLLFRQTLSKYRLDEAMLESGTVIVGYSGGADSSCLLRLLNDWCRDNKINLYAVHVNHMIRGDEADRDQIFCEETCRELGVPLEVVRADVPGYAKELCIGIEEAARKVRYQAFDSLSEKLTGKTDGAIIATAHNSSDNLETVIFNMLRGAGTHGLCGIDPIRDGRFIRPLICDSGEDIRRWCEENGVEYVTDRTNADTDYTRNRIRHKIIPEMREITPIPENAISRLTDLLRGDDDYLDGVAQSHVTDVSSVDKELLNSLHTAISSRVLRILYDNTKDDTSTLAEVHVRSILDLAKNGEGETSLSLPGKITAAIDRKCVRFLKASEIDRNSAPQLHFTYPENGDCFENELCKVTFSRCKHIHHNNNHNKDENIYKLSILTSLSFDKIVGSLKVRYRQDGDTYFFSGMTRKVKKLFGDKKLSSHEKSMMPIFYDNDGIVWIPGFPPRDGMKLTDCGDPIYIQCDFYKNINIR